MSKAKNGVSPVIEVSEYASRRTAVLKALKGAVGIVYAGEGGAPPLLGKWRPDFNFFYLTGIDSEPGAAVLFNPNHEDPAKRCMLFLKPLDMELQRWDGARDEISSSLRSKLGFSKIMRLASLPEAVNQAARTSKRLACLHPFAAYTGAVSPDLTTFRKVAERMTGVSIEDHTNLLPSMRAVKSPAELALMKRAARATALGYEAAARIIKPGVTERAIQLALENAYRADGATGPAYNSIVGAGFNGTVLHYMENADEAQDGDLVVIDSGAVYDNYTCDVTRTFPVSGTFTKDQRDVYNVVLRAQEAAIKAARPGAKWHEIDGASRAVIEKAGMGDAYIHSVGHQLGLEVHDVTPDGPLKAGMVITIEPGVYFPDRKMGIRIEDDILVSASGPKNLTVAIPKRVEDVEASMRG